MVSPLKVERPTPFYQLSNKLATVLECRNEPLTVQSPGTQPRSFCYVSDMVDGLIQLMERSNTGPINIGNPGEFTMIELAETVKEHYNHFLMVLVLLGQSTLETQHRVEFILCKVNVFASNLYDLSQQIGETCDALSLMTLEAAQGNAFGIAFRIAAEETCLQFATHGLRAIQETTNKAIGFIQGFCICREPKRPQVLAPLTSKYGFVG
ncbi:UDP-glucuronic acid decarboxylase 3 [Artemisia annua]|uniref:UDP-glucuronic acid decarboxylase 3 n=1 Tax=Artemisia annua TaxID=35608 RepID=A0A2U1KB23_ARTAN|nr:UDP-glucuronic acid decarboxylase 3 [Artemisia annua]